MTIADIRRGEAGSERRVKDDQSSSDVPLDPAAERLRTRLTRLLLVSGGFMILGFIAVFAALVYKMGFFRAPAPAVDAAMLAVSPDGPPLQVAIPAGARLISADLQGGRALLTLGEAGSAEPAAATTLLLVDLATGIVLARYELVPR